MKNSYTLIASALILATPISMYASYSYTSDLYIYEDSDTEQYSSKGHATLTESSSTGDKWMYDGGEGYYYNVETTNISSERS